MASDEVEEVFSKRDTIFFFCDVTTKSVRDLCQHIQKASLKYDEITVNIRSDGGCMYAGLAGMDFIRSMVQSGTDVTTVALGYCASAAVRSVAAVSREHTAD
jgi:ATP-dependent protease ClpP protease subunit